MPDERRSPSYSNILLLLSLIVIPVLAFTSVGTLNDSMNNILVKAKNFVGMSAAEAKESTAVQQ